MHAPCVSDPLDFEALYCRYWEQVVRFCTTRLTSCPEGMAEEVAQEVFLIAHRALAEQCYRHEGMLSTWLYGIARNLCAKAHRTTYRHTTSPTLRHLEREIAQLEHDGVHRRDEPTSPALGHSQTAHAQLALLRTWLERERQRLAQHIGEAMHGVSPASLDTLDPTQDALTVMEDSFHQLARQHRQAYSLLHMYVLRGMTVRELAVLQGMSRSAIHRSLAQAKTTLRLTYQVRLQQEGVDACSLK
jgi:RNA polymerase sigma factor (sigma-70 family)